MLSVVKRNKNSKNFGGIKMNWKNKKIIKLCGSTFNSILREIAIAVNRNADVLQEACNKIEELQKQIELLNKELERSKSENSSSTVW